MGRKAAAFRPFQKVKKQFIKSHLANFANEKDRRTEIYLFSPYVSIKILFLFNNFINRLLGISFVKMRRNRI